MTKRTGAAPKLTQPVPVRGGRAALPKPRGVPVGRRGRAAGTLTVTPVKTAPAKRGGGRPPKKAATVGAAAAAVPGGGRRGKAAAEPKPSQAELDAQLDSYMADVPAAEVATQAV